MYSFSGLRLTNNTLNANGVRLQYGGSGILYTGETGNFALKSLVDSSGFELASSINSSGFVTGISITGDSVTNLISATGLGLIQVVKNANEIRIQSNIDSSGFALKSLVDSSGFITNTQLNNSGFALQSAINLSGFQTGVAASSITLSGWDLLVSPADIFGWTNGGASVTGTAAVPVYWVQTQTSGEDWISIAVTSSLSGTNPTQGRYGYSYMSPATFATGWGTTGLLIQCLTTLSGTTYNSLGIRITDPTGAQFTQTGMFSNTATGVQSYFISGNLLPPFSTNHRWTVRYDYLVLSGQKAGFVGMWGKYNNN